MKIIFDNQINGTPSVSGSPLNPIANVLTDQPQQRFIGPAQDLTPDITITAGSGGIQGLFMAGISADSVSYNADSGGSTAVSTFGQRFEFEPWVQGTKAIDKSLFIDVSASTNIVLTLTVSTDYKAAPVNGNSITNWVQSSLQYGNVTDGSSNINVVDHGYVRLGGHLLIGGTEYQIIEIQGNGTATGSIKLSESAGSAAVSALKIPAAIGIIRAGRVKHLDEPTFFNRSYRNYSKIRTGSNGIRIVSKRSICQTVDMGGVYSQSQADDIVGLAASHRGQPMGILLSEDMTSERDSLAVWAGMTIPEDHPATPRASFRNLSFSITEVA